LILFLDTSACIKLYIDEPGHDVVTQAVQGADTVAAHLVAYAEMRAALARLWRMKRLSAAGLKSIKESFEKDWSRAALVAPTEPMIRRAGDLAERFGLRGYDSVHLAAAESLLLARQRIPVCFASFDESLNGAAAELGLSLLG
jgi:predicted nucleic acid-binding protein